MKLYSLQDQKSEATKAKLTDAAKAIIGSYGMKYLTVRNICEESGVSTGSFYHHFKTKENLVSIIMREMFRTVTENNPFPEDITDSSGIGRILWPFLVYAVFCEKIGPEAVSTLCYECSDDLFEENCFEQGVKNAVRAAFRQGALRRRHGADSNADYRAEHSGDIREEGDADDGRKYRNLYLDLEAIYKGIVAAWCMDAGRNDAVRSLSDNMLHVLYRFLLSFAADNVRRDLEAEHFLWEFRKRRGGIDLTGVNVCRDGEE